MLYIVSLKVRIAKNKSVLAVWADNLMWHILNIHSFKALVVKYNCHFEVNIIWSDKCSALTVKDFYSERAKLPINFILLSIFIMYDILFIYMYSYNW